MSVKNPRTIIQYICKWKYRASSSSLKRKAAFYVCACSTVYICVAYFLLLETVPHDRKVKPMKIFSSGKAPMPLEIWRRFQDFRHDWYRQRRARFDWQTMIKPCSDNMAWGLVKNHWGKQNRTSARKSEIVHQDIRPAGEFSKIFIQSKTADNQTKRIGGDSWRVNVAGPSAVSATVFDHLNGTYEALFLLTEPGVYEVRIVLDYSLCDGFKDPPRDWFIKGNAQGKFQKEGLLGALDHYMREPFDNGNPLIIYVSEAQINTSFVGKNPWDSWQPATASSQRCCCTRTWRELEVKLMNHLVQLALRIENHDQRLMGLLQRCRNKGIKLSKDKCKFRLSEVCAVKIAKSLLGKAAKSKQAPHLALLDWRNTPSETLDSSPAQRLFGRRTKTLLPTPNQLLRPEVPKDVKDKLRRHKAKQIMYYNRGATELGELNPGDFVRIQPQGSHFKKKKYWTPKRVEGKVDIRSYQVRTEDRRIYT